jgi:leucyl/phenylalanyl-tRNA--protein transferase
MAFEVQFPDPNEADDDGLVAIGGNLSTEFLLAAYSQGLFPWFNEGNPILWWSPNPRMVLYPDKFKCSKSLKQILNKKMFTVKVDTHFDSVIRECATIRRTNQKGTWITKEMSDAYVGLHQEGFAHSFETYFGEKLVGGLYGLSLGKAFFGESMFYKLTNASKVALFYLCEYAKTNNFDFIDVQQSTEHMHSLGAEDIPRKAFLHMLEKSLKYPTLKGKWRL